MKSMRFARALLLVGVIFFAAFAVAQPFIPTHLTKALPAPLPSLLPKYLAYCLCAWLLAKTREEI